MLQCFFHVICLRSVIVLLNAGIKVFLPDIIIIKRLHYLEFYLFAKLCLLPSFYVVGGSSIQRGNSKKVVALELVDGILHVTCA